MWKAMKYRCKASWQMIGILVLTAGIVLFMQREVLYETSFDHIALQHIIFPIKSWMFLTFFVSCCLMVCVYMQYLHFSLGKTRFMLLRNHRLAFSLGNTIVVFLILTICYIMLYLILKQGLETVVSTQSPKATQLLKDMLYQRTLEENPQLSLLLVMNLCHTGKILLWLFALSMWTQAFAVSRILIKQRILDVFIGVSIIPLLLSFFSWTSIWISLILCICDVFYIQQCWEPKRMYR